MSDDNLLTSGTQTMNDAINVQTSKSETVGSWNAVQRINRHEIGLLTTME